MATVRGFDQIKKAIDNQLKEKMRNAASYIANALTNEAHMAISMFYGHYSPVIYKRSGALTNSYKRYYKNPHNTIYHAGVEIKPDGGSYRIDSDFVTAQTWFYGKHGNWEAVNPNASIPPIMSPTPYQYLLMKRDHVLQSLQSYF